MATIPQKELRNNVGEVLRCAERGEEMTVTVSGRPVARLGPVQGCAWVSGPELRRLWDAPAAEGLDADLARFAADLADPFAQ